MKLTSLLFLSSLALLTSCSSYVDSLYKDFEQQERTNGEVDIPADSFDQYRHPKRRTSREYNRVDKIDRTVTTNNVKVLAPDIKRQYKDEKSALKRMTASDLTDNGNDGSLWAGSDPNAFLFSNNRTKSSGDIVQINVLPRLKNEITMELKKAFPDNPYENKVAKNEKPDDAKAAPGEEKKPAEKKETPESNVSEGAQDKISGVVVEEINREHLLIKGRKNVLYKNRKRMVEVQALVSRKDIGENDSVSSDAILESNISVVR
jgi:flagellar L-ring protein precursor FlgH